PSLPTRRSSDLTTPGKRRNHRLTYHLRIKYDAGIGESKDRHDHKVHRLMELVLQAVQRGFGMIQGFVHMMQRLLTTNRMFTISSLLKQLKAFPGIIL